MKQKDIRFLREALLYAKNSNDPSTQNGAILVRGITNYLDNMKVYDRIIGRGANNFPKGIIETKERWQRPIKYNYVEHAERNAIYDAAHIGNKVNGSTLYCPWFACTDCARGIIQAGIKKCVGLESKVTNSRWDESIKIADEILKEGGIKVERINYNFGIKLRRNDKLIEF